MKKLILFIFLILCVASNGKNFQSNLYKAFMNEDVTEWEKVLSQMNLSLSTHPNDSLQIEIVKARCGLLYLYAQLDDDDKISIHLKQAEKEIETLLEKFPDDAVLWAKRTSLVGYAIKLRPYKVMVYGPRSLGYITKARELNRHLPDVMIEYGNTKYNAPSFAGGDKNLGLRQYRDAVAKMVSIKDHYKNDWFFLMVHLNYAQMLKENDDKKEALRLYKWLLRYEPGYHKLSNELIPELEKELKLGDA